LNLLSALRKPRAAPPRVVPLTLPVLRKNYSPADVYVVPRVRDQATGAILHLDRVAARYTHVVLIGESGAGKSCALNFLAQVQGTHPDVPLHSLADFHPGTLPQTFEDPDLILLDDVAPAHAGYLSHLGQQFPRARTVVAAHEGDDASAGLPAEFARLALLPFNERELSSAVEAWFPNASPAGHGGVKPINRAAEAFVAAVKANAGTRWLATNPLNLFLLLQIYAEGSPLPTRRAELFDTYARACLQAEPLAPSLSGGAAAQVTERGARETGGPDFAARALEGIALSTKRGQLAKDEHLTRGYGFLRERPSGRVEFVHPLLQDFLAARGLRRNPDLAPLLEHVAEGNWEQVVLFYAGLGETRPLVEALLERGQLELAAQAQAQAAEMPEDLHKRLAEPLIQRAWQGEEAAATQALGVLRSNIAVDYFAARLKDRDPAARARAARILGQLGTDRAVEYLLPQLRDTNADVRDSVVAALGKSKSDRVIEPLLVALRGDTRVGAVDARMRVAAARALGEVGTEKAVPALVVDLQIGEPEVRAEAVQALIKIRGDLARKPLQAIVASNQAEEVRAAAEEILKIM
jgi:HEAT repeats/PBS lyase HEAT-like repeat